MPDTAAGVVNLGVFESFTQRGMADKIRFKFEAKPVAKNTSESEVLAMWLC